MIDNFFAIDYQVHSFRSHDGKSSIQAQCTRAVEVGLDEIGFSEHKDFDPEDPVVDYFDYDAYLGEIEAAQREWGIDYQRWFEDKIAAYLAAHSFDFVIGSVHHIDRVMLMTPEYNRSRTAQTAYQDYFRAITDSVQCGLFDILGHLEYANRRGLAAWGPYRTEDYWEELTALMGLVIAQGLTFEINTAGLHQNLGITYPVADTVALYAEQGGRLLSIGSDAHHPDQLAHAYAEAARLALSHGLTHVSIWDQRQPALVPLKAG